MLPLSLSRKLVQEQLNTTDYLESKFVYDHVEQTAIAFIVNCAKTVGLSDYSNIYAEVIYPYRFGHYTVESISHLPIEERLTILYCQYRLQTDSTYNRFKGRIKKLIR